MFASKATTLILRIFLFFLLGPAFAIVTQASGAIQSGSGTMNPLQGWSSDNIKQIEEASASMPQWFQSFGRALYEYDKTPFLVASVMMRDPVLRTSALAGKGFFVDGLGGTVNGLWKMVSSPIQTVKGIGSAIANYDQTWGGIKKGLSDFGGRLASGDPTAYGQSGFEIASLFFPAAKASELSHLKYLSKGDEALKLAKAESLVAKGAVKPYEVGMADNLWARSVKGDGLDVHHAGQAHPMEQLVPGYDRATGPAITVPRREHVTIPTVRGPVSGTPRSQLSKDIWDLRNNTNAPNSRLQELIDLNKTMYPNSFKK